MINAALLASTGCGFDTDHHHRYISHSAKLPSGEDKIEQEKFRRKVEEEIRQKIAGEILGIGKETNWEGVAFFKGIIPSFINK